MELILLVAGLAALLAGGEVLVRGASRLAALFGVSPLIIGLTVVSFGTSAPELAVSVLAASGGHAGLTVGNIVGSNIFNVLLVLGLSAAIAPLLVKQQLIRLDVPLMIGASLLMWVVAQDGLVAPLDGLVLVGLLSLYLVVVVGVSRRERADIVAEYEHEFGGPPAAGSGAGLHYAGFVVGGAILLVVGSSWLVDGAVGLARGLGVSDLLIGLTIVAVGTSLPELTTSVVAAARGERDIAVGNVVGSNIFNILCVLGLTAIIAPAGVLVRDVALAVDIPFMIAVAAACLPLFATGRVVGRLEGAFLLVYAVAYATFLVAASIGALPSPLAVLGLLAIAPLATLSLVTTRGREVGAR